MAEGQSRRSLELQISNRTWRTTLKYHRGDTSPQLSPELPPDSSDSCQIFSNPDPQGNQIIEQLLVYEAESFTLAIFFLISHKPDESINVLQLELSLDKTHLQDLRLTLLRMKWMGEPPDLDKTSVSRCAFSSKNKGFVLLNAGPGRVTATLCHQPRSLLEVQLDTYSV